MTHGNNAVIYDRFSSHGQNEDSGDQQYKVCMEFAKRNGYNIIDRYSDEAKTGTKAESRDGFQQMIRDSRAKQFQYIIVYKLDRFARNRYDSATYKAKLKKNGVKVISACEPIADDPSGILLESVLEGQAEYFSANLSENVKRGMDDNATQCLCTGGQRTLGYKIVDKKFEIDPDTAPVVKNIFEMYVKGHSQKQIIDYLNGQGLRTSYGNEYGKNSIRYIIRNKRYAGYYLYKGTETKGGVPAIVSEKLFEQAQAKMAKTKKAPARAKANEERNYLLSACTTCGFCGRNVTGISGTSKTGGKTHYYYRCSCHNHKAKCEMKSLRRNLFEDFIVKTTLEMLTPERIDYISKRIVETCEQARADKSGLTALESRLKKAKKESQNILKAIKAGKAVDTLLEALDEVETKQKDIEREIARENSKFPLLTVDKVKFFFSKFAKGDIKDTFFRQRLVDTFIHKIIVDNEKITILYNSQDGDFFDSSICKLYLLAGVEGIEPPLMVLETIVIPLHHTPVFKWITRGLETAVVSRFHASVLFSSFFEDFYCLYYYTCFGSVCQALFLFFQNFFDSFLDFLNFANAAKQFHCEH